MKTSDLVKQINSQGPLHRNARITRDAISTERRTVNIAFSSEDPYQRYFGMEILGHKTGEVDMSFMASGSAPFLDGHDPGKQIGVIEKAWIGQDRKGRATIRFSKNQAANEVFQDIVDGIRKNISVGYDVKSMKLISEDAEGGKTYRVNRWQPLEASSVAIPADMSVGVGRADSDQNNEFKKQPVTGERFQVMEKQKNMSIEAVSEILALGEHRKGRFREAARDAIKNGWAVDKFRAYVLEKLDNEPESISEVNLDPNLFGFQKDNRAPETPIADAILAQLPGGSKAHNAGAALEKSQELSRAFGKKAQGVFVPLGSRQTRTLQTDTGSAGGYTVAEQLLPEQLVEVLRNASMVLSLGATVLNGLVGDVSIPRQSGTATAYYVAENGDVAASDQSFEQIRMTPHTIGARTTVSRRTLLQSSLAIEQFVRADLMSLLGTEMDAAAINGSGASGQPLGILNTTGIGSVTLNATNTPDWGDIVDLETAIATDNALAGRLAYLTNSTISGAMKKTAKDAGSGLFLIEKGQANGYPVGVSNNVPTKHILFGNWKDLVIGMWGVLDVIVDPYSDSAKGQLNVTAFLDFDIAIRHPESFADGYAA